MLVHLDNSSIIASYRMPQVDITQKVFGDLGLGLLPYGWKDLDGAAACRALGNEWARSGGSLALRVPSAVVPLEFNFLLNSRQPDFGKLRIGAPQEIAFDSRLVR